MKNKFDFRIIIIIVLTIILSIMIYFYYKDDNNYNLSFDNRKTSYKRTNNDVAFTTTSSISSSLTENIPLRTGYYFKKLLVTDNVVIKKGTKIIEYTNGKYLKAPYDLILTQTKLPSTNKVCTNDHYITISSFNILSSEFRVDETKIDSINIGQTVKVKVPALNDKEIKAIVTDITSTATNGKFTATIEFDNDGTLKLGMTINITV